MLNEEIVKAGYNQLMTIPQCERSRQIFKGLQGGEGESPGVVEIEAKSFLSGSDEMIVYKVFCKDGELRKGDLIGVLAERRKDLRGSTRFESGLRWARFFFTDLVKDRQEIFIVPKEFDIRE
jgi:hypothetical protein